MDKHNSEYELGRQTESMDKSRGVDDVLLDFYSPNCCTNIDDVRTELYNIFKRELEGEKRDTRIPLYHFGKVTGYDTNFTTAGYNEGIDKSDQVLKRLLIGGEDE